MTFTAERIAELRALIAKTTPLPWRSYPRTNKRITGVSGPDCKIYWEAFDPVCLKETHETQKRNAQFIAVARKALPEALDEIERQQADLAHAAGCSHTV